MLQLNNLKQLLGAHTSIKGGVAESIPLAQKLHFTAMQIFTKNNNRWFAKSLLKEEIGKFKTRLKNSKIKKPFKSLWYFVFTL